MFSNQYLREFSVYTFGTDLGNGKPWIAAHPPHRWFDSGQKMYLKQKIISTGNTIVHKNFPDQSPRHAFAETPS